MDGQTDGWTEAINIPNAFVKMLGDINIGRKRVN